MISENYGSLSQKPETTCHHYPSVRELRCDVAGSRERMARLEGLFEGFMRRESAPPA